VFHSLTEISSGGIVLRTVNSQREWLLVGHAKANHWGFPKGHVGDTVPHESLQDAALREVREEGGIVAKILSDAPYTAAYSFHVGDVLHQKTVHYFLMQYLSGDPQDHDQEVSEALFIPEEQVADRLTYQSDKDCFTQALQIALSLKV